MTTITAPLDTPSTWRRVLPALLAVLALVLVLYRETAWSMVQIWARSDTFMHAFLVPPIVAWLIWRDRARVAAQTPRPMPWVLLPIALAAAAWVAGELLFANALSQFAFTAMLVLVVPALAGAAVTRALLFPLLFSFFAVPVGEFLMPVLIASTADFTVNALRLSGIPVYREGQQFMIPTGSWSVVEACSGVRYLIASAMVGTLFAYLNFSTLRRRLAFVAVSLVVPIVANWLRAYMIVMLGHLSGNRLAVGVDHLVYGWVFFGIVMMLMFVIGGRWSDPAAVDARRARLAEVPPFTAPPAVASASWRMAALTAALLALPPAALGTLAASSSAAAPTELSDLVVPGWRVAAPEESFAPVYVQPTTERRTGYERDGRQVSVYIARYRHQDRVRKLAGSQNVLLTSQDDRWLIKRVDLLDQQPPVQQTLVNSLPGLAIDQRRVAWRLFRVDGRWVATEAEARIGVARQRLAGRGDDSAAVILWAADAATLQAFLADARPVLEAALQPSR